MRIPRFWSKGRFETQDAKGKKSVFVSYGWSDQSQEEAIHQASQRAKKAALKCLSNEKREEYPYPHQPLREEVLEEIKLQGKTLGIITRNAYGAKILNTTDAMFIDIDFPVTGVAQGIKVFMQGLLGQAGGDHQSVMLKQVEEWQKRNSFYSLKVYRTFKGLRCLILNHTIDPLSSESQRILSELGSDKNYLNLCRIQECYRARLTPKPWRCRMGRPPSRYPWENPIEELKFRKWEDEYLGMSTKYSSCHALAMFGSQNTTSETRAIIELHDQLTGAEQKRPLA